MTDLAMIECICGVYTGFHGQCFRADVAACLASAQSHPPLIARLGFAVTGPAAEMYLVQSLEGFAYTIGWQASRRQPYHFLTSFAPVANVGARSPCASRRVPY